MIKDKLINDITNNIEIEALKDLITDELNNELNVIKTKTVVNKKVTINVNQSFADHLKKIASFKGMHISTLTLKAIYDVLIFKENNPDKTLSLLSKPYSKDEKLATVQVNVNPSLMDRLTPVLKSEGCSINKFGKIALELFYLDIK